MNKEKDGSPSAERQQLCEVYSNQFYLGWTGGDLRLLFRQLVAVPEDTGAPHQGSLGEWPTKQIKLLVEDRAAVTMSWPYAKILMVMLEGLVKQYEELNGEIKHPMCPGAEFPAQSSPPDRAN